MSPEPFVLCVKAPPARRKLREVIKQATKTTATRTPPDNNQLLDEVFVIWQNQGRGKCHNTYQARPLLVMVIRLSGVQNRTTDKQESDWLPTQLDETKSYYQ